MTQEEKKQYESLNTRNERLIEKYHLAMAIADRAEKHLDGMIGLYNSILDVNCNCRAETVAEQKLRERFEREEILKKGEWKS